jgi:hypothetical protein
VINYWLDRKRNTFYFVLATDIGIKTYQFPSNINVLEVAFHGNYNTQAYHIKNGEITLIPTPDTVFKVLLKYEITPP